MKRNSTPAPPLWSRFLSPAGQHAAAEWPAVTRLSIREATAQDVASLMALAAFADAEDGMNRHLRMNAETLHQALFGEGALCGAVVADVGGPVVGAAHYHRFQSPIALKPSLWMDDLFVIPHYRNQGLGTRLIAELSRIALREGCDEIDFTAQKSNRKGLRLYRRLGALVFGETRYCRFTRGSLVQLAERPVR